MAIELESSSKLATTKSDNYSRAEGSIYRGISPIGWLVCSTTMLIASATISLRGARSSWPKENGSCDHCHVWQGNALRYDYCTTPATGSIVAERVENMWKKNFSVR